MDGSGDRREVDLCHPRLLLFFPLLLLTLLVKSESTRTFFRVDVVGWIRLPNIVEGL